MWRHAHEPESWARDRMAQFWAEAEHDRQTRAAELALKTKAEQVERSASDARGRAARAARPTQRVRNADSLWARLRGAVLGLGRRTAF